jgi:hypothetical protein
VHLLEPPEHAAHLPVGVVDAIHRALDPPEGVLAQRTGTINPNDGE